MRSVLVGALVWLALPGCVTQTGGAGGSSTDGGASSDTSDGWDYDEDSVNLGEAEVTFPETGQALLIIEEEGQLGSVTYYGTETAAGPALPLTGFEAYTVEDTVLVALDEQERPTEISIGSTVITVTYNLDGTFNYELHDNGELLFSDESLSIPEVDAKGYACPKTGLIRAAGLAQLIEDCRAERFTGAALLACAGVQRCADALYECLISNGSLTRAMRFYCLSRIVLTLRLIRIEEEGVPDDEYRAVIVRTEALLERSRVLLDVTTDSVVGKLWEDPACRGEEELDCTPQEVAGRWRVSKDYDCDNVTDSTEVLILNADGTVAYEDGTAWPGRSWGVRGGNIAYFAWDRTIPSESIEATLVQGCAAMIEGRHIVYSDFTGGVDTMTCWTAAKE